MNIINYNAQMEKLMAGLGDNRPKLLLHACCAPCASSCLERLKDAFDLTVFFYNPNIDGEKEYSLRASELKRLCAHFEVNCVVEDFNPLDFHAFADGMAKEKEGGKRCCECFKLRLKKTADKAEQDGFDYFATTLTVSPLKNARLINELGQEFSGDNSKYLPTDFKKKNGYIRSVELSAELGLYRQNYCGCEFSKVQQEKTQK